MPDARITVDPTRPLGNVSPNIYGQFSEHLVNVVLDGLWAELVKGRKFETPIVEHGPHPIASPWRAFADRRDGVEFKRGPNGAGRHAPSHRDAHHVQSIVFPAGHPGEERGIACPEVAIDEDTTYVFRARLRSFGGFESLRVALRDADGETVLASTQIPLEPPESSFPEPARTILRWMDPSTFQEVRCELTASGTAQDGFLTLTGTPAAGEPAEVHLDWVSLMPADNIDGWHRETIEALRDLPVRSVKWPGGCFADGYDWRLGIGPRDARHCYVDPAWLHWEENDVGIDEYMRFCDLTDSTPLISVNHGTGTPEQAAAWVEYCNGDASTTWGALRAEHGHPEPYGVRDWVIGNEVYGFWERGGLPADRYAERFKEFAAAMKAVDPTIRAYASTQIGEYTQTLLASAAEEIDGLAPHLYPPRGNGGSPENAGRHVAAAASMEHLLRQVAGDIDAAGGAGRIRVAVDEWGWSGDDMAGALFNASTMNSFHRMGDLVSFGHRTCVINADGVVTRRGQKVHRPLPYAVFELYNRLHRPEAVAVELSDVSTYTPAAPLDHLGEIPTLDVSALHDPETGALSVFVVNRDLETAVTATIGLAEGPQACVVHTMRADDLAARNQPGHEQVRIEVSERKLDDGPFEFPPASLVAIEVS